MSIGREGVVIKGPLAIDPTNPNTIYAGSYGVHNVADGGLVKSTDGGASWNRLLASVILSLAVDPGNPNIIYTGTLFDGVFKSTDGGASWKAYKDGFFDGARVGALVIDPNDTNYIYAGAGNGGIFKSTDAGSTWKQISENRYYWLVLDTLNRNTLYAGSYSWDFDEYDCFKSTDGGINWSPFFSASALALDPLNSNTIYAGTGYLYTESGLSILKSTDGGVSWQEFTAGLPDGLPDGNNVSTLVIDPANTDTIYAGVVGKGAFRSTDAGASWSEFNAGLTNHGVGALAIDSSGTHLHAATDAGVFDYQFSVGCAEPASSADQSFEVAGGNGSVAVTAELDCHWTAISNASWLNLISETNGDGNGTVEFSVAVNNSSTHPRITTLLIDGRSLTITQAGAPLLVTRAEVFGKNLYVYGEKFVPGALILVNGDEQITKSDPSNPKSLIGKKAGKKIISGQSVKLQVRNPNGALSPEFIFTRP